MKHCGNEAAAFLMATMTSRLLLLTALFACDQTTDRKPHPLAPSLPLLSTEEYQAFEKVIDRFIQADTGKLTGEEKKKAIAEFKKLGSEAVFQLIEGGLMKKTDRDRRQAG